MKSWSIENIPLFIFEISKAPFIAGQLDFCLNNLDVFTPVLVGFNPVNMAR